MKVPASSGESWSNEFGANVTFAQRLLIHGVHTTRFEWLGLEY